MNPEIFDSARVSKLSDFNYDDLMEISRKLSNIKDYEVTGYFRNNFKIVVTIDEIEQALHEVFPEKFI